MRGHPGAAAGGPRCGLGQRARPLSRWLSWHVGDNGAPLIPPGWAPPGRDETSPARGAPGAGAEPPRAGPGAERSAERVAPVTGSANHPEPLIALHVRTSLRTSKERGKS